MDSRAARIMTWCALGIALVTDALYVALIRNQAQVPPDVYTAPFVTVYLVALAALLGLSIAVRFGQATRTAMRGAAAGGLLVLGVIAAFSIGLPLIVGGILAGIAAARSARPPGRFAATLLGFAAAFVAVAVLIAGFEVTERAIVCPVSGTASGGGAGFVTGPYHYQCVNGRLNFQSGSCNGVTGSIDSSGNPGSNGC